MNLVVIAAFIVVCGAAKLDRTYLPPSSASTAGGGLGSLQTPLTRSSEQERETSRFPTGSYTNSFGGVVVDAASPGTRASSDADQSGLGAPRPSYGSSNSKVGDAAFRGSVAGFRDTPSFGAAPGQLGTHGKNTNGPFDNSFASNIEIDTHTANRFSSNGQEDNGQMTSHAGQFAVNAQSFQGLVEDKSERPQAAKDRNSNILALSNDVNIDRYSYGFETDNGITVGENGVAVNGIQAEGEYSYQGDDGQVYKVTYTADEGGYRPQGAHLPTPPPIPDDILKSLEQNAKEEAAGIVDDGSYDAQKYNADGDYTHNNGGNIQHNGAQLSQYGKRPESGVSTIGTFNKQNSPVFGTGSAGSGLNNQNAHLDFDGQSSHINGNTGVGFGAAINAHNFINSQTSQLNRKPQPAQLDATESQSTLNGQSSPANDQTEVSQIGTGLQSSHSSFVHSNYEHGNQFESDSAHSSSSTGSQSIHSSQPLSGHRGSLITGQSFGHNIENKFTTSQIQSGQAQFGSQFGQQPLVSAQYENQSPELGSQPNQQGSNLHFSSKPSKPLFGQGTANSQLAQPQFGSSFKPQGSEAFSGASLNQDQDTQDYGKPFPQTFSGQNYNRPSGGSLNFMKPALDRLGNSKFGSSSVNSFNRFPQIADQFGTRNEYLPPFSANGQTYSNEPGSSAELSSNLHSPGLSFNVQKQEQNDQNSNIDMLNGPKPSFTSASASASSFGQPTFQPQPAQPLNAINTQSQPNQLTQQTSRPSSQTQAQFNLNSQQLSALAVQSADFGSKPTTVPDTELTTPLEPNEAPSSQNSQFSSQTSSNFGSFGSKPASIIPAQAQFGSQESSTLEQQSTSQTLSNLPSSSPHTNSQFETASTQTDFKSSVDKGSNISNSQLHFGQTQQKQPSLSQSLHNSYYYNQPSKTFGTTGIRPQVSRFPSSSSYQSNGVASQNQFFNQHSFSGSQSLTPVEPTSATQLAQTQSYNGITQAAISQFPSASPTSSNQFSTTQNGQFGTKPSFNQQSTFVTQVQMTDNQEKISFPLQQVNNRLPTRPNSQLTQKLTPSDSQTQAQFGQVQSESPSKSTDGSLQQQTTLTQQYQGTIYEYNKPAEVLPAPSQTDSSSSQSIETGFTSESKPSIGQSLGNQLPTQQNARPFSEVIEEGSKLVIQSNKPFGNAPPNAPFRQNSQSGHPSTNSQKMNIQFGSQSAKPFTVPSFSNIQPSLTAQSGVQPAKPFGASLNFAHSGQLTSSGTPSLSQQNTQGLQTAQSFKPYGAAGQSSQSSFGVSQFGSQTPQFSQTAQSFQNTASSQNNGYFYPGNPKPQFYERSKTQFNQNSQPGKPQLESNQYSSESPQDTGLLNQQSFQFNSASKPQFGAQPQDNQNVQATFDRQTVPGSSIKPLNQPLFGQSITSSQATVSGEATASATASIAPQQYKPFGSQNKNQVGQTQKTDNLQIGQSSQQFGVQNLKPNSNLFGENAQGSSEASKPLFNSACCRSSKDSTSAQSTDRPSSASFQGTQKFNAQGFAGKGEQFGGPRQPPRFDAQTGYHY